MDRSRVLIVTPVRNEAEHLPRMAASMLAQTRPPDLWLVADDGSDDATPEILRHLQEEVPFLEVLRVTQPANGSGDRLTYALEARAFNAALAHADLGEFTHVGKLDGDVELPRDYFSRLLREFERDPGLGIAGGSLLEPTGPGGAWQPVKAPARHVHGAVKLYSRECFERIGGVPERLGWDGIDETYARMRGFETRREAEILVKHHRPCGSNDGRLRGSARHGACAYILRSPMIWVLGRSFKIAATRPRGLSGLAFIWGYLRAAFVRTPRVEDEEFQAFVRTELRARAGGAIRRRLGSA